MTSTVQSSDGVSDSQLQELLRRAKTIAVVGLSPKADRPSYRVAAYLQKAGYRIIPIRPANAAILGEACYASLDDIPAEITVDIVDVFRAADETPAVAEAAVRLMAGKPNSAGLLWLQSGIVKEESMAIARQAGLVAVQDLCLMVAHRRFLG
ncbi:MAG: CoA-binding protein [Magnetococcales bacterium]|nr:CoA-binding protein [Magnetococcales bacterium]MBF0113510.1 CoA-binding protein [Magnetococcales bacterium]